MRVVLLLVLALLVAPALSVSAAGPVVQRYTGAGTVVTSFSAVPGASGLTVLDNGAVVCRDADLDGVYEAGAGGQCISFSQMGDNNAVYVHDDQVADANLAFQVCVDNNGDGICSGDGERGAYDPTVCADRIFFSHGNGYTVNPLGVAPASAAAFFDQCHSTGFRGLVVILCAGAHDNTLGSDPHAHRATTGTVAPARAPFTGGGNYCGGLTAAKAYEVVSG